MFFFLFWSKEAVESFRGLGTSLGCLMLPEALSDDSIVQPRPEEEEKQTSPKSPREVLEVSVQAYLLLYY